MNVKRRELRLQETQQTLEALKFTLDKAIELVSLPAVSLVGGFILVNMAQNKVIGRTEKDEYIERFWWKDGINVPDIYIPAGSPKTLLTDDQANLARAALLALAGSGMVNNIVGALK